MTVAPVASLAKSLAALVAMPQPIAPIVSDLTYAPGSARHRLDLWLPEVPNPPLVVFLHGGAFRQGDKSSVQMFARPILRTGFALASLNYRLSGEAIWPAQLHDLRAAFAFLREEAPGFGFDGSRIASFGPSAGGHLSAWAGIDLARDPQTRLAASVIWFPPVDFSHMDADMAVSGVTPMAPPNASPISPESLLIGAPVRDNPDLAWAAGPLSALESLAPGTALPPMLILHGALDPLIAAGQSQRLHDAVAAFGTCPRLEFSVLPGGTHGGGDFQRPGAILRTLGFLRAAFA
jgi:acetyl esterase/lipase